MKSFGIGLALLASGFAAYVLTSALKSVTLALTILSGFLKQLKEAGIIPEGATLPEGWETLTVGGIPQSVLNVAPYICLGIMVFGVAWFWLIEPIFYLAAPPKKEAEREMPPVPSAAREPRAEPMAPSSRDLEQWIAEAIREKMERGKGK